MLESSVKVKVVNYGYYCDALPFNLEAGVEAGNCSEGSLRLVNHFRSDLVGRLEICVNNAWGTICDVLFGLNELEVACAQLGGTGTAVVYTLMN